MEGGGAAEPPESLLVVGRSAGGRWSWWGGCWGDKIDKVGDKELISPCWRSGDDGQVWQFPVTTGLPVPSAV